MPLEAYRRLASKTAGSLQNRAVAGVVILVTRGLKLFARGTLSVSAVEVGLLAGHVVAHFIGMFALGNVATTFVFGSGREIGHMATPSSPAECRQTDEAGCMG